MGRRATSRVCGAHDPTVLPGPPKNFLLASGATGTYQHAVFPGCDIPPAAPNTAAGHVWYFDPVNGQTQAAGGTGADLAHAFKDVSAIFASVTNYASSPLFGFGRTIPPGDTIYVEPGDATHPVGHIVSTTAQYSTSNGTDAGTPVWTWIMTDPASPTRAVLNEITLVQGSNLIFNRFAIEPPATQTYQAAGVSVIMTSAATPAHDMLFEDIHASSQVGHGDDPWTKLSYPMDHGSSNGTVVTAAAAISNAYPGGQNPLTLTVTMAAGASSVSGVIPDFRIVPGNYVFSPQYYGTGVSSTYNTSSGIPNGTVIKDINWTCGGPFYQCGQRQWISALQPDGSDAEQRHRGHGWGYDRDHGVLDTGD